MPVLHPAQLIDDKKVLSEKCEAVVAELKQVDQKYGKKMTQMQEQHELVRGKGRWWGMERGCAMARAVGSGEMGSRPKVSLTSVGLSGSGEPLKVTCGALSWLPQRLLSSAAQSQEHGTYRETVPAPSGSAGRFLPTHPAAERALPRLRGDQGTSFWQMLARTQCHSGVSP